MNISEEQISEIVNRVVTRFNRESQAGHQKTSQSNIKNEWGVFDEMGDAVEAAHAAFLEFKKMDPQDRKEITDVIRRIGLSHREELARMVYEETGMGRYEDKILKHTVAAEETPGIEDLTTQAWSGKNGLAVEEFAPYGVIGAVTPSTHPSETIINNAIMMLSAGNAVVFGTHPSAKNVSAYVVQLCNRAMAETGAPGNLITTVRDPSIESANVLFKHEKVPLLSITGGPAVVRAAMQTSKKVIAAGPGNPPVVIDETADLAHAARMITKSAGFDNNILCTAEKEVFVVDQVFNQFMKEMEKVGNKRLVASQMNQLAQKVFEKKKYLYIVSRDFVGRNASVLAAVLGMQISDDVPLLFGETQKDHLFVKEEQMMPCLPVIRVKHFEEGVALALEAEHGYRHTASVFTKNMDRATGFAKAIDCSIFVINGGTYQGDGGTDGEGTLSYTIATPTGEAITRPRHFARLRRVMTAGSLRFI